MQVMEIGVVLTIREQSIYIYFETPPQPENFEDE